ncbi:MAG TPA: nucleotidyltransferase domain-containing protein [Rubrobacteraceae bacterium]|nr:nucleotidyltransferase domain-containing protein [Rubrobacteraceae bacterium]
MSGETRTLEDVIRELDGGLRELYGERHRGLVLYGSHGRGEADEGSDVDLLLLLEGQVQVGREIRRSSDLVASLSLESSRVLSLIPVSVEDYRASSDPYLVNARREGALLSPAAG